MKRIYIQLLALASVLSTAGCNSPGPVGDRGGVAISFDDRFFEEWVELRPLLNAYGAKVTFYINGDTLTGTEAQLLHQLAQDGHEIGFHGTIHGNAEELMTHYGPTGYLEKEIWPGLHYLRRQGFNPATYAHPGGTSTARTDSALLANGFLTLREVSKAERYYKGMKLYHLPPVWMSRIFYDFDGRSSLYALQIDRETELSKAEMSDALQKARSEDKVLMLFGHQPLPENPSPELYGFELDFLKHILEESQRLGLRFYRMSELR